MTIGLGPTFGASPGIGAITETTEAVVWWGRQELLLDTSNYYIDSATVDAANTITTDLRPGLLLGKITSSSKLKQWDPSATDGSERIFGVLARGLSTLAASGSAEDKQGLIYIRGPMRADQLRILGAAFVGHASEHLARRQMTQGGRFHLDDQQDMQTAVLGGGWAKEVAKTADYTVVAADNGTLFSTLGASGAVNFTLPALEAGLVYEFINRVDQNMTVTSAAGNDIVTFNDDQASSLAFSTSSQKIGARVRIEANDAGNRWYASVLSSTNTITVT